MSAPDLTIWACLGTVGYALVSYATRSWKSRWWLWATIVAAGPLVWLFVFLLLLAAVFRGWTMSLRTLAEPPPPPPAGDRQREALELLGQAHDLLCDLLQKHESDRELTVLDAAQEEWARRLTTRILEHKFPELCQKKPQP